MNPQNTPITILEELKRFIPQMLPHERAALEQSILAEGCKTPLIVWRRHDMAGKVELILVDGHNRKEICDKHRLAYRTEEKEFRDLGAVREYMALTQNGRRNATALHKAMMIGAHYEAEKGNALDNLQKRTGTPLEKESYANQNTADRLAKFYKTNDSEVKLYNRIYKAMKKVETVNPTAIPLIYQTYQKEGQIRQLENFAYTDENSLKAITNHTAVKDAIKAGKQQYALMQEAKKAKKNPKVQKNDFLHQPTENDIITSLQEYNADLKRQIKQIREPSYDHIARHLQELLDKSNESYEGLLARFKVLSERYNLIAQKKATSSFLPSMICYKDAKDDFILFFEESKTTYTFSANNSRLAYIGYSFYEGTAQEYKLDSLENVKKHIEIELSKWDKKFELCNLDDIPDDLQGFIAHFCKTQTPKVQSELSENLQIGTNEDLYNWSIYGKSWELQKDGYTLYRLSEINMCIKVMNEKGNWTSPKELQFTTKTATQKKWHELMKQPKTISY